MIENYIIHFDDFSPPHLKKMISENIIIRITNVPNNIDVILDSLSNLGKLAPSIQNPELLFDEVRHFSSPLKERDGEIVKSTSNCFFSLHTDGAFMESPFQYAALYCKQNTVLGGDSLLLTAKEVFEAMSENQKVFFEEASFYFGENLRPIFSRLNSKLIIRYNLDHIMKFYNEEKTPLNYDKMIRQLIKLNNQIEVLARKKSFRLKENELLIFDNQQCLHGREKFSSLKGKRLLLRFRTS